MYQGVLKKIALKTALLIAAFSLGNGSALADQVFEKHSRITKEIRTNLIVLEGILRSSPTSPHSDSHAQVDGNDPWSEIQNLQFYMWRSFAFDPNGLRPLNQLDTPTISASEITEDLENRFLLVKGSGWPESLGLTAQFNEYMTVCQEIIEFRKKRLYADAKAIAKRGDLDEAFRHLIDAIEHGTSTVASTDDSSTESPNSEGTKATLDAKETLKLLRANLDSLETLAQQTPAPEALKGQPDSPPSDLHGVTALASTTLDKLSQWISGMGKVNGRLNTAQTSIILVASFSTLMLVLFLFGLTRKPDSDAVEPHQLVTPKQQTPDVVALPGQSMDAQATIRISSVTAAIEDEQNLATLVQIIESHASDATVMQVHLQWLAKELDVLRATCSKATSSNDIRVLSSHLSAMTLPINEEGLEQGLRFEICSQIRSTLVDAFRKALVEGNAPKANDLARVA